MTKVHSVYFVTRLPIGPDTTRVGAVRFSSDSALVFNLDDFANKAGMKQMINDMKYDGHETNIAQALNKMRTEVFVQGMSCLVLIEQISLCG